MILHSVLAYGTMAIVHNCPLTETDLNDPNNSEPLTTGHLLTLKSTAALPLTGKFINEDLYTRKRWRHVQFLAEQFWSNWWKKYLASIATRQCWHAPRRNLQIGDIVLVKEEDLARNKWRIGRVLETTANRDGFLRLSYK